MQVLRWRTQTLVDSTVASTAQLSSSAVLLRESLYGTKRSSQQRQGRNERGNFRPDFERERRSRRDERDNIFLNFDRIQRSNRGPRTRENEKDPIARLQEWQSGVHGSFSFKPGAGGKFSRSEAQTDERSGARRSKPREEFLDELLPEWMEELGQTIYKDPVFQGLDLSKHELGDAFDNWSTKVHAAIGRRTVKDADYQRFKDVFPTVDATTMKLYVKYGFYGYIVNKGQSFHEIEDQKELANLRYPTEWFPATRGFQREFHLHVGPTNSGKTYHALKRLEQSESGLYAGPLRLLAHEVYMRLNAKGSRCNLVTGDERRAADEDADAPMTSCTVEMIPLNVKLGVAVIDEIQMIGSTDRGWAWTQAVLGVMAKEVHCCGEERAVPIMQELVAMCGEKLHVHRYKRLTPLQMDSQPLNGNLRKLQKGDCVVAFSVVEIHALRQEIEKVCSTKVAVIYGSLPPETRAQQAKLFNDPDSEYDILVASNAIGMGLNLSIKRMIFVTTNKFDGAKWSTISIAEGKQIAGRAGRYSTAAQDMQKTATSNLDLAQPAPLQFAAAAKTHPPPSSNIGYVTTLDRMDYPVVESIMSSDPEPLISAGIQPPTYIIERFARQFPLTTPFAYLLIRLQDLAQTSSRFFQCEVKSSLAIADTLEGIDGLSITDRLVFCAAPIEPRKPGEIELARAYARLVAESKAARIVDIEELDLNLLAEEYEASRNYLRQLEGLHKGVIIWNWLSYRFAGVFMDRPLADHVKSLVEARIEETLQRMSFDYKRMRKSREKQLRVQQANEERLKEDEAARMTALEEARDDVSAAGYAAQGLETLTSAVQPGGQDEDHETHGREAETPDEESPDLMDGMMEVEDLEDAEQEDALEKQFNAIGISEEPTPAPAPDRQELEVVQQEESLLEPNVVIAGSSTSTADSQSQSDDGTASGPSMATSAQLRSELPEVEDEALKHSALDEQSLQAQDEAKALEQKAKQDRDHQQHKRELSSGV